VFVIGKINIFRNKLKYVAFKFKIIWEMLDVSLDVKCVYTKGSIHSDIPWRSG